MWTFPPDQRFLEYLPHVKPGAWMPCPRCGSSRVKVSSLRSSIAGSILAGAVVAAVGYFEWRHIPWVYWSAVTFGVLAAVGLPILSSIMGDGYKCGDCRLDWAWKHIEVFYLRPGRQGQQIGR